MKFLLKMVAVVCCTMAFDACQRPNEISQGQLTSPITVGTNAMSSGKVIPASDISVKGDYEVRNGLLYFKDATAFLALDSSIRALRSDEKIEFTNKLGFKSLLSIQTVLYQAVSQARTQVEYDALLQENKDIVRSDGEHIISLFDEISAPLLNREGMVSIGGKVHCYAKEKTIVSNNLDDAKASYKANKQLKETTMFLTKKSAPGARSGTCSSIAQVAYSSDNNRRVEIIAYTDRRLIVTGSDQYGNFVTVQFYTYVRGDPYKKQTFGGGWTYYSTSNNLAASYFVNLLIIPTQISNFLYVNTTINNPLFSNQGTFIDYSQILATYYNARQNPIVSGSDYVYSVTMGENSPAGYYISGGVPAGVAIKCVL